MSNTQRNTGVIVTKSFVRLLIQHKYFHRIISSFQFTENCSLQPFPHITFHYWKKLWKIFLKLPIWIRKKMINFFVCKCWIFNTDHFFYLYWQLQKNLSANLQYSSSSATLASVKIVIFNLDFSEDYNPQPWTVVNSNLFHGCI